MRGVALAGALLLLGACDWEHYAFMNSLPVDGDPKKNPVVHVYLAVDGLAFKTVTESMAAGQIPSQGWQAVQFVSTFPSTSDIAWSRILRTERMNGYELHYFNPEKDALQNVGYTGLISHGIPPLRGTPWEGPPYLKVFDYHADGYFDAVWSYGSLELSLMESLDNLFYVLGGRVRHNPVFVGYVLDIDVMGHMRPAAHVKVAFLELWRRIEKFRRDHPAQRFVFTLVSDHGMDFVPAAPGDFIDIRHVMEQAQVRVVDSFAEGRREAGPYAVPILHTPVSYVSLHTELALADDVAERLSQSPYAEAVVSRSRPDREFDPAGELQWFSVWVAGKRPLHGAHHAGTNAYYLPEGHDLAALGIKNVTGREHVAGGRKYLEVTDEALYSAGARSPFPDVIYRARTALLPVGIKYPADVVFAFKRPYASRGFRTITGVDESARHGFHGNLDAGASMGVVLTEEKEPLPAVLRADDLLRFFPKLRQQVERRTGRREIHERRTTLDYARIKLD